MPFVNCLFKRVEYGSAPHLPPTRFDACCDRGTSVLLNFLIVFLFLFNAYAQVSLVQEFEVVPNGVDPVLYEFQRNEGLAPWESPSTKRVVSSAEFVVLRSESLEWMQFPNLFGGIGILLYVLLRFSQPWYLARVKRRFS